MYKKVASLGKSRAPLDAEASNGVNREQEIGYWDIRILGKGRLSAELLIVSAESTHISPVTQFPSYLILNLRSLISDFSFLRVRGVFAV